MVYLFMNSGLVLIMLCSECSFIRHKNKIVVWKTQKICVFPSEWNGGIFLPIHSSVGLWLEFQSNKGHAVKLGGRAVKRGGWGKGGGGGGGGRGGGGEGQLTGWAQGIIYPRNSESIHQWAHTHNVALPPSKPLIEKFYPCYFRRAS